MTTRRTFVGWLSGLGAALGVGVRGRPTLAEAGEPAEQGDALDAGMIRALADAILPSELGDGGTTRVARAFAQWIGGYRAGAEIVHPYGSAELRVTGASPVGRWRMQLGALDRAARDEYRRAFPACTQDQRRQLVTAAFGDERLNRLPDPLQANHVAMALLAWYFTTPDAADLCYQAQIGKNQCRPLVNSSRQPLPLRGSGRSGS